MQKNKLYNHYNLESLLKMLRYVLTETRGEDALELLNKAVAKAQQDPSYASELECSLLYGSTVELRELLSAFGDYFKKTSDEFPYYPHHDAVNGIDSAMGVIKFDLIKPGTIEERITDYREIHLKRS